MTFSELAKARYSLRKFSGQTIDREKLDILLEAGCVAPTAHNNQPQRLMVISDEKSLTKVDECTPCRYGAPVVLMICYDKDVCWKRGFDGADSGMVDASIVTTHIMLAAQDLGMGSCWVMNFDPAKAAQLFSLPENIVPAALLPIGYPEEGAGPSPRHTDRVPASDILLKL